jgi:hypothetical protein
MSRRSSAENRKLFNDWTGKEKSWLDELDSAVAELLVEGEGGRVYLRDNLTDEEHKLYYKWERRSKDPSYCRMQDVKVASKCCDFAGEPNKRASKNAVAGRRRPHP